MSIRELVTAAGERFAAAGIESARVDAELLLAHVLQVSRAELMLVDEVTAEQRIAFEEMVSRREQRIPLQHITGRAAFRRIEIAVGPGVLTPRPETELVVDAALKHVASHRDGRVRMVDLCSGSAAMTVSLAIEAGDADVWGLEFVDPAFQWGLRTREDLQLAIVAAGSSVELLQGDVRGCEARELVGLGGTVDVVVSNPPYVPIHAVPRDPEVHAHEPAEALYGGEDGMLFVDAVVQAAAVLLKPNGLLVIEHGDVQGEDGEVSVPRRVRELGGFQHVVDHLDLAGRPRYTTAIRR
jgi:release factor glutamine methyltransferase